MGNILPVLQTNTNRLENPRDIMKSILRYYMYNPKNINDTFADREISFIFDVADNPSIPALKDIVTHHLESVLKRYFPRDTVTIEIDHNMMDEKRFELSIDMLVRVDGTTYNITQDFNVDENGKLAYD